MRHRHIIYHSCLLVSLVATSLLILYFLAYLVKNLNTTGDQSPDYDTFYAMVIWTQSLIVIFPAFLYAILHAGKHKDDGSRNPKIMHFFGLEREKLWYYFLHVAMLTYMMPGIWFVGSIIWYQITEY